MSAHLGVAHEQVPQVRLGHGHRVQGRERAAGLIGDARVSGHLALGQLVGDVDGAPVGGDSVSQPDKFVHVVGEEVGRAAVADVGDAHEVCLLEDELLLKGRLAGRGARRPGAGLEGAHQCSGVERCGHGGPPAELCGDGVLRLRFRSGEEGGRRETGGSGTSRLGRRGSCGCLGGGSRGVCECPWDVACGHGVLEDVHQAVLHFNGARLACDGALAWGMRW